MSWYKDWLFYTLVIGVFVFDQVTKAIIRSSLSLGDSWPEEGIFRIVHGLNTGSAFGLFAGFTNLLVVASIIGIVFILFVFLKQNNSVIWLRLSLGLIVGGALGNLFDRVKDGAVVDFISVGWWPAFNIADSSISVGMCLLLVTMLLGEKFGWIKSDSDSK
jgi:signal peptidase II|tara:strand:- start:1071 stop:1553 length:483 start_codon:yes stop_codon:yes gene_type:complete